MTTLFFDIINFCPLQVGNCTGTPVGIETPTRTQTRGGYIPVNPRVRVLRVRVYICTGVDPPCGFNGFP
jgi:hypothetical protein